MSESEMLPRDTTTAAHAAQVAACRHMGGDRRLAMGLAMSDDVGEIALAGIRAATRSTIPSRRGTLCSVSCSAKPSNMPLYLVQVGLAGLRRAGDRTERAAPARNRTPGGGREFRRARSRERHRTSPTPSPTVDLHPCGDRRRPARRGPPWWCRVGASHSRSWFPLAHRLESNLSSGSWGPAWLGAPLGSVPCSVSSFPVAVFSLDANPRSRPLERPARLCPRRQGTLARPTTLRMRG